MKVIPSERKEQLRAIARRMGGKFGAAIDELLDALDDAEDKADGIEQENRALLQTVERLKNAAHGDPEADLDRFFEESNGEAQTET